ncbi:MAG: hypothetical protein QM831_23610 [Kofleriaceae bacterium]
MRISLVLVLVGCGGEIPSATKPLQVKTELVEITDAKLAREYSHKTTHTALPFAFERDGVNGTLLVLQFLDYAEQHGARYVSSLDIRVQMVHEGTPVECVSTIVLEGDPRLTVKPAVEAPEPAADPDADEAIYSTKIKPWLPPTVKASVDDHDYMCASHAEQVSSQEPNVPDPFDVTVARETNVHMIEAQNIVWHDECHLEPRHREVTRYEHFVAAHFEPPDWDRIAHAYAERRLIELPPDCHRIAAPATGMVQQIEADFSYPAQSNIGGPPTPRRPRWH